LSPQPAATRRPAQRVMRFVFALMTVNLALLSWKWVQSSQTARASVRLATSAATDVRALADTVDLTRDERRVERIGWYFDWDQAHAAARDLQRPIFLLTMDGDLDGRC